MKAKKAAAIMLCAALGAAMVTGVSVSAKDKDELEPRLSILTLIPMRPCLRNFPRQKVVITMW